MKSSAVPARQGKLAINRLRENGPPSPGEIDKFIEKHDVPIPEGSTCTFLFRGDADAVHLKHFIYGLPSKQTFRRIDGTDLWYLVVEIPPESRCEYKLEVVQNGNGEWIEDPLNPLLARDPFGANSVCHGTGYEIPEWTRPDPESRPGTLEEIRIRSSILHRDCPVTLYFPARFRRSRRYPLLVVHDGGDFLEYSGFKTVLDNLIHRLEISELVVAFLHPRDRLVEYGNNEGHSGFLTEELIPRLESRLPLVGQPQGRCIMGASFGAVAAFASAWRNPDIFGGMFLLSGSFAFTDIGPQQRGPAFDPVVDMVNTYRNDPTHLADKIFVSCGMYESLIYENRSLVPLLQKTGMEVRYLEARDGHNWENWRDRLREGLSWLYPGPLWMVYE